MHNYEDSGAFTRGHLERQRFRHNSSEKSDKAQLSYRRSNQRGGIFSAERTIPETVHD